MFGFARDPELVKRIGQATALEARATGIPYVFAPCVAVIRSYQPFYIFPIMCTLELLIAS